VTSEWDVERLDLAAYLERIGHDGDTAPTAATLAALHRAHVAAIPFENLDIILGRGIAVDLESVQARLVRARRGGYCYEHGLLLAAALERLGFAVERFLGRVGGDGEPTRGRTHMTLRVQAGGEAWLADVGFGAGLLEPLPFDGGGPRRQGAWTFALAPAGPGAWALRERRGEEWVTRYRFADERQYPADVVVANHFTSTFPRSPFVLRPVAMRRDEERISELVGDTLTVTRPDRSTDERAVADGDLGAPCATSSACRSARRSSTASSALGERSLELGQTPAQRPLLLPLGGDVAHDRGDPDDRAVIAGKQRHGELDGDPGAVGAQGGHGERAAAVLGLSRRHHAAVAVPVALAQLRGDDQVERPPERLRARVAEHRLGGRVPEADRAVGVGDDDGVVGPLDDDLLERAPADGLEAGHGAPARPAPGRGTTPGWSRGRVRATASRRAARRRLAAATSAQTATATHVQSRANATIQDRPACSPTAWLIAAYIPTGNTVLQRRGSKPVRGPRTSPATRTGSHAIAAHQSTSEIVARASARRSPGAADAAVAAASAAIASAPPATHWSPRPRRTSRRSNEARANA
jgi:N-hydroxyarylamine O-acetyltransferase